MLPYERRLLILDDKFEILYKNYDDVEDEFMTIINSAVYKLKYISINEKIVSYNYTIFATKLNIGKKIIYVLEVKLKDNEILERQIFLDTFTGLFSREFWKHLIDNKLRFSKLCIINLSNLKEINNDYGYHIGDKIIKEFARLVRLELNGDIVIRYSGIDFIILSNKNENSIANYFNKIFNAITGKFSITVKYYYGFSNVEGKFNDALQSAEKELLKLKGENTYSDSIVLKEIENIRLKLNEMMAEDYKDSYDDILMLSKRLDVLLNEYMIEKL